MPELNWDDIDPEPVKRRHITFDQAYRLATMSRSKYGDFLQTALWATLTAFPNGVASIADLLGKTPSQAKWLDLVQAGILVAAAMALIIATVNRDDEETAQEYLNSLFKLTLPKKEWKIILLFRRASGWSTDRSRPPLPSPAQPNTPEKTTLQKSLGPVSP